MLVAVVFWTLARWSTGLRVALACLLISIAPLAAWAEEPARIASQAGLRLGIGAAAFPGQPVMPMTSLFADMQLRKERVFLQLATGVYVPATQGRLSYGGLGLELGAGLDLSDADFAPYIGGGVAGRFQISDTLRAGFAPYANVGVRQRLSERTSAFAELRAAQNVLPVVAGGDNAYPTELGLGFGLHF